MGAGQTRKEKFQRRFTIPAVTRQAGRWQTAQPLSVQVREHLCTDAQTWYRWHRRGTAFSLCPMTNDEDRLYVFWITYWHQNCYPDVECASMFVHQRVLTNYISRHASRGGPPLDIPWAEWGPSNTCFMFPRNGRGNSHTRRRVLCAPCLVLARLKLESLPTLYRHVHGQCVVFCHKSLRASSSASIEILDFSRAATFSVKRHLSTLPTSSKNDNWEFRLSNHIEATKGSSLVCDHPLFEDDIWTYLPSIFRMCVLRETSSRNTRSLWSMQTALSA
jgi:hypothetical protein